VSESGLSMFGQEKLKPEARDAASGAAQAALDRRDVSASAAITAYGVDLLLAEGLGEDERTDARFIEHGATLAALDAYHEAREAAERQIARLDPDNAGFVILFSPAALRCIA